METEVGGTPCVGIVRGHPHPRSKRFRGQTRVESVENGCAPTSRGLFRTRRVATWLAVSRVFPSRAPLSGDRDSCQAGASDVLHGAPTGPEFKVEPHLFRTLVLERLRLPLPVTEAFCEFGSPLDVWGRHRAACPRSGRLRARAVGPERSLARVCREAGATALTAQGLASPGAAHINGAALLRARRDKELEYHELVAGNRCALVVVAVETGGRWSSEAVDFVSSLAGARARDAPPMLRRSSFLAWRRRWSMMLAVSCGRAFASSLVTSCSVTPDGQDGPPPDLADLLA